MPHIANTPKPPYYAVIFTACKSAQQEGYARTAERMFALAAQQPGYLGHETIGDELGSITISYWESLEAIDSWRDHAQHQEARRLGRERWYEAYAVRICKVQRERRSA